MDWAEACRILGVPESAQDAEIKEQYFYKAQLLHPDKNQDKPEGIRKKAEAELALINQAYAFLSNQNNNPYRIPPKLEIEPCIIRFKLNAGEKKTATLVIKNIGGSYTNLWIDSHPAPWLTVTAAKSMSAERLPLEVTLECVGTGEPDKRYTSKLAVKLENEITHVIDTQEAEIELLLGPAKLQLGVNKAVITAAKAPGVQDPLAARAAQRNKGGFSFAAFVVNFAAFAILGGGAIYLVNTLFVVDKMYILIGSIVYGAIAFGFSFNHGFTVGSAMVKNESKNRKP